MSWPSVKRWATRDAAMPGMADRSSRPHRHPNKTPRAPVRKVVHLRWQQRLSPVEIGARLGIPTSSVHAILVRCRLHRLSHVDRRTGELVGRYEHDHPGAMIHVDVKKRGNIPDGGGWRYVGRAAGEWNRAATSRKTRKRQSNPLMGTAFVHTINDAQSRVAYAEMHDDETSATAVTVLCARTPGSPLEASPPTGALRQLLRLPQPGLA